MDLFLTRDAIPDEKQVADDVRHQRRYAIGPDAKLAVTVRIEKGCPVPARSLDARMRGRHVTVLKLVSLAVDGRVHRLARVVLSIIPPDGPARHYCAVGSAASPTSWRGTPAV